MGNSKNILFTAFLIIIMTIFIGCSSSAKNINNDQMTFGVTEALSGTPSRTSIPTLIRTPSGTPVPTKPTVTMDPNQQTWLATARAIQKATRIASEQTKEALETRIASFPKVDCNDLSRSDSLSPDGEWVVTSCGGRYNHYLIIHNMMGIKWDLEFNDFLPISWREEGMPGGLSTVFWDSEGDYLYFTTHIGWSGGGDECFPGFGTNGLFRLDLKTGYWVTLINPPTYFPGDEIKFAPTGRRYAVDKNGVMISDLKTGEVIQINATGVMDLSWSPDGTKLAFSTADCNEEGKVIYSSVFVWDTLANREQEILTITGVLLHPESWHSNNLLRIKEEKFDGLNNLYSVYTYDLPQRNLVFVGTATPYP